MLHRRNDVGPVRSAGNPTQAGAAPALTHVFRGRPPHGRFQQLYGILNSNLGLADENDVLCVILEKIINNLKVFFLF